MNITIAIIMEKSPMRCKNVSVIYNLFLNGTYKQKSQSN